MSCKVVTHLSKKHVTPNVYVAPVIGNCVNKHFMRCVYQREYTLETSVAIRSNTKQFVWHYNIIACKKLSRQKQKREDTVVSIDSDLIDDDMEIIEESCSREFRRKANSLHHESLCRQPRKKLVEVKMPSKYYMPGVFHRPKMVDVNRCDGVCQHPNHMCLPIEKDTIDIHVTTDSLLRAIIGSLTASSGRAVRGLPQEKCMIAKIERHLKCGCKCMMTEKNCSAKQMFARDRCACECVDVSKGSTCGALNKMWDPSTCECECSPAVSRQCSTGAVFNNETCRCIQETKRLD